MSSQFTPKLEILPEPQKRIWPELSEIPESFILFGGTAIALHLGHRQSVDFDFFSRKGFDPDDLLHSLSLLRSAQVLQKTPNTLTAIVERGGEVRMSFFSVPSLRQLGRPERASENNLQIANLLDLAGTKAAMVQKRAEAKDYFDLDALIRLGGIGLPTALAAGLSIYGRQFNPELTLKALCHFGDGNLPGVPDAVRVRLADAVKAVQLNQLPVIRSDFEPEAGVES